MVIIWLLTGLATVGFLATPYYYLALLPAPVLLTIYYLFRNPSLGFYIIVFLIPFGAYRKLEGALNLPWLIAAVMLVIIIFMSVIARRMPDNLHARIWPILITYLLISLVSAALSSYPDTAYQNVMLLGAACAFVFIGLSTVDAHGFWHTLPLVVIWSVSISSILGLLSFYTGLAGFSEEHLSGTLTRNVGGSIGPNNMCLMILFALPLIVHRYTYANFPRERILMATLVLVNLLAITTTHSRSGFIILIVVMALIAFNYRHRMRPHNIGLVLGGAFLAGTVLLAVIPTSFWERVSSLTGDWQQETSLSRRASYIVIAEDAIWERPLIGSGPGVFAEIYADSEVVRLYTSKAKRARRAHNTYLEIVVGTGILGITVFLLLLLRVLLDFLATERKCRLNNHFQQEDLMASYRIGFIGLLVFLLTFSEMYHKYMLLSLVVSQLGRSFTRIQSVEEECHTEPRLA